MKIDSICKFMTIKDLFCMDLDREALVWFQQKLRERIDGERDVKKMVELGQIWCQIQELLAQKEDQSDEEMQDGKQGED